MYKVLQVLLVLKVLEDRLVQSADAHARWLLHDTQISTWWPSKIKTDA